MRSILYEKYFDKVYGCMIGKCVAGTAGAPYEGMKQKLNLKFSAKDADTTLPNDDLDLQILWLEVLENKGIYVTSDDLANIFLEKCPYSPGEYAVFKKNYRRHIHPPMSGTYNNAYYLDGMGCPIRSEIWACISPGNPVLSSELAKIDGVIDHGENSVYAESFLAAMEAEAFFVDDMDVLIEKGLEAIPKNSKMHNLITDVIDWCKNREDNDWETVRQRVIRYYGHPDCTNVYQNMGFLLLALLKGNKDFIKTMEIAINCGYDTDCTGATVGAVLGVMLGAKKLEKLYGFTEQIYNLGVLATRRSNKISDLAEDICRVGIHFSECKKNAVFIENCRVAPLNPKEEISPSISICARYVGEPVISPMKRGEVILEIRNHTMDVIEGELEIKSNTLEADINFLSLSLTANELIQIPIRFQLKETDKKICDTNLVNVLFNGTITTKYVFGFAGAVPWKVYGPYWRNNNEIDINNLTNSYMEQFCGKTQAQRIDSIRDYQLNAFVDDNREYHHLRELSLGKAEKGYEVVYTYSDKIKISDVIGYQGPCCIYMTQNFVAERETVCRLYIGGSDSFSLWMNGAKIAEQSGEGWWTGENIHIYQVKINEGNNNIAVRLSRHSDESYFSFNFLKEESAALGLLSFPEYMIGFEYIKP